MNTARVTWFGKEGKLHLQMRRFPAQKEVKCRLDDITTPERKRHRDLLLVRRADGALINVGALVPESEVIKAIEENPIVDDRHTGFFVNIPRGYGLVDNMKTSELNIVPAGQVPEMTEPVALDEENSIPVGIVEKPDDKEEREFLVDELLGE